VSNQGGAPEILPELSKSATRLKREKLERVPWDHSGRHPGSPFFTRLLNIMFEFGNRFIFRESENDKLPSTEGGVIYVSTHINGLVDPMVITRVQDKRVISLGRHDLMTRPIIGWWARKFGSQPVLRRAEIEAGIVDAEFAKMINQRGMLTVSSCLAAGHSAVVMPEGKSHQDSRLHALRTGSPRSALAAAGIAFQRNQSPPVIQTVGLHWRTHYLVRTDCYVEFGPTIQVPQTYDLASRELLCSGTWVEPSKEATISLRDEMFDKLSPLTPEVSDWETYRAWKLIANMQANKAGKPIKKLSEEIHETRKVRERLGEVETPLIESAKAAADILNDNNLYSNAIGPNNLLKEATITELIRGLFGLIMMLCSSLVAIPANIIQTTLAWILAGSSDEGLDSRTTYFMLAGMFSPILFWWIPISVLIATTSDGIITLEDFLNPIAAFLLIYISSIIFVYGYDLWTDFITSFRRRKLSKSPTGQRLNNLLESIDLQLVALK